MKRNWPKPVLIESVVCRDREHIELFATTSKHNIILALIAPEDSVHANNGRVNIQWLIGNANVCERKLRKLVETGLSERLLKKDDLFPWTSLVHLYYQSENLYDSDNEPICWTIKHSLPTAPQRTDWMFEDILDDELIACCMWEYGRESHSLGLAAEEYWIQMRHTWLKEDYERDPKLKKWHDKKQAWIEESLKKAGVAYGEFIDRFWQADHANVEIYEELFNNGGPSAPPWLALSKDDRERLVRKVSASILLHPFAPALLGDLERLWNANNGRLLEIRMENRPSDDDSEDCELYAETNSIEVRWEDDDKQPKSIIAAFAIDFSRFTDREILNAFRDWLKQTRPALWKRPRRVFPNAPQRGRKLIDYRVALERLSLMRLLHENYPDELRENYPKVWKRFCRDETHFRRECKLACDFFRTLFPFLPEDEMPRSSKPLEIWEPEIETELARQEIDGSSPTGK